MITYVNTVFVSNNTSGAVLTAMPTPGNSDTASSDAGKFIFVAIDADSSANVVTSANAMANVDAIKIGMVTEKNTVVIDPSTKALKYTPIIKWSNIIRKADLKSYVKNEYAADTEDAITIDFTGIDSNVLGVLDDGGKRIIVRLTFKDLPTRYRKWTESYEYVTAPGDTAATIAANIATLINKQWKRARVFADGTTTSGKLVLTAMKYDDDNVVDSISWYNKVRFNANIYYTDPAAEGWESLNKHYPTGVAITKVPGKTYIASAKLVRDREAQAMGYEGILNRGEGTYPIIKPNMQTNLSNHYDAITLEFENMYRAADDIFRKTKQAVEIYGITEKLENVAAYLDKFVNAPAVVPVVNDGEVGDSNL